ncbi:MAG TPA: PRC-barrel domain-containing protein [Bradyrhizobium sp.]|nr:PRC-barrel domain-containing protein [Bradyrhizobium sp.]
MSAKYVTVALAGTALLATVAFAQTPAPTGANTAPAALSESSLHGDWRVSKVVGLRVYNDKNENLGTINDLLMDKSGNIKAVVLGVGGFLGVGEHLVAVSYDKIKFVDEPVAYVGASGTGAGGGRPMSPTTTGSSPTGSTANAKPNPWYPDHAVFDATKDVLKAMPEFKYST